MTREELTRLSDALAVGDAWTNAEREVVLNEIDHLNMRLNSLSVFADALGQMSSNLRALLSDTTTGESM